MDIAAGEYGYDACYFRRMLSAGAVDVLQADATRCAGMTGFLQAGALCEAFELPFSFHCAPAHARRGCLCRAVVLGGRIFFRSRPDRADVLRRSPPSRGRRARPGSLPPRAWASNSNGPMPPATPSDPQRPILFL